MDTPQVLLDHHLKTLRLPTFLREYDKVAQQCADEGVDFPRYLLRLSELELLDRERRATERRIRQAKFDVVKSLDTFDFLAIPSLNKSLVLDMARCEFIERKENILALGNSGTGKTHIALALGLAACQKGFRVRFTTAASLAHELIEAKDERRLMRFQKMLSSFELLIIDELGFPSQVGIRIVSFIRWQGESENESLSKAGELHLLRGMDSRSHGCKHVDQDRHGADRVLGRCGEATAARENILRAEARPADALSGPHEAAGAPRRPQSQTRWANQLERAGGL